MSCEEEAWSGLWRPQKGTLGEAVRGFIYKFNIERGPLGVEETLTTISFSGKYKLGTHFLKAQWGVGTATTSSSVAQPLVRQEGFQTWS